MVNGFPGLASLMIKRVEDVDISVFLSLDKGDILFIDSSHVLRTGGDLPYIYFEILLRLKTGAIIHVYDIFFPQEYPEFWITEHFRF